LGIAFPCRGQNCRMVKTDHAVVCAILRLHCSQDLSTRRGVGEQSAAPGPSRKCRPLVRTVG